MVDFLGMLGIQHVLHLHGRHDSIKRWIEKGSGTPVLPVGPYDPSVNGSLIQDTKNAVESIDVVGLFQVRQGKICLKKRKEEKKKTKKKKQERIVS